MMPRPMPTADSYANFLARLGIDQQNLIPALID
jgi:hypothetical protein